MMLSEGHPGVDSRFSLYEGEHDLTSGVSSRRLGLCACFWAERSVGVLRLELLKEVYERTGLKGSLIRDGGRMHIKSRYSTISLDPLPLEEQLSLLVIEIDLREPSMLHGRKGFERIVWACKNVLGKSLSWLFYDFGKIPIAEDHPNPLAQHHPIHQTIAPEITQVPLAKVPSFATSHARQDDQDWTAEIHEWLNLVALQSPRVEAKDDTHPYLCCYHIPCSGVPRNYDLVSLEWNGFLPASWIRSLFVELW